MSTPQPPTPGTTSLKKDPLPDIGNLAGGQWAPGKVAKGGPFLPDVATGPDPHHLNRHERMYFRSLLTDRKVLMTYSLKRALDLKAKERDVEVARLEAEAKLIEFLLEKMK